MDGGRHDVRGAFHRTARFRALEWDFAVETDHPLLSAYCERVFGALRVPGDAEHWYTIRVADASGPEGAAARCRLELDGDLLEDTDDPARPFSVMVWHINRAVIATGDDAYVLLHASAAAIDGTAVVMPGDMEVGKTTLVTALVRSGLQYLTDECVAVDPANGELRAFPRSLSLDPGSWPLFPDLEPVVDPALARFLPGQWQIPPDEIWPGAAIARARASVVVFPRYEAGAGVSLTEIARADALVTLAGCAFNLHSAPERNLAALGEVVRGSRCFTLVYDDLAAAVTRITALVREAGDAEATAQVAGEGVRA